MKEMMHFWYSRKQSSRNTNSFERNLRFNNYCEIDGEIKFYTSCSSTMDHGCAWDDMEYLGYGVWHHADRI